MTEFSERLLANAGRKGKAARLRPLGFILTPLVAILFQAYVTRFFPYLNYLQFPLLLTIHFALMRREPLSALFYGAAIGLAEDSLSTDPLGMYGIVKTLVGYFAASVSMRFEVDNPFLTVILAFFFFCFHQFFHWVLSRALLGLTIGFDYQQMLMFGLLNAVVALPLFRILDKLKAAA